MSNASPLLYEQVGRILTGTPSATDWETVVSRLDKHPHGIAAITVYLIAGCFRDQWETIPRPILRRLQQLCEENLTRAGIPTGLFFDKQDNQKRRQLLADEPIDGCTLVPLLKDCCHWTDSTCRWALHYGATQLLSLEEIAELLHCGGPVYDLPFAIQPTVPQLLRAIRTRPRLIPCLDLPRLAPHYQEIQQTIVQPGLLEEHPMLQPVLTTLATEYIRASTRRAERTP